MRRLSIRANLHFVDNAAPRLDVALDVSRIGRDLFPINIEIIRAILESAQEAWNSGSVEGVLDKYVEDIIYTTNTGGPKGESVTIQGKENVRHRYLTAMEQVESRSQIEYLRWDNGLVRTRLLVDMQHRETGVVLTTRLRQIIRFRGFLIAEIQDFHDAARLAAFWRFVGATLEHPQQKTESV
ncbi:MULTISPECIES: nuclear transport factor 2 family protein [unclassified Hyphomicrobium]|uniref:nuclear transport factor 2 family protein n=1 Tax=unclassified Hyphomicrobium TaxID=2619925 RepID=UPI0012F4957A|nr:MULTISPECIES: nuclear transport factor 2 family protein [unclassified Hyphomicrobium]